MRLIEVIALLCFTVPLCMLFWYGEKKEEVREGSGRVIGYCAVEYVKSYTELGTIEYVPEFKCDEQDSVVIGNKNRFHIPK